MINLLVVIIAIVLLVAGTILTEAESFGWATVCLLATVAGVQFFHVLPLWQWASEHVGLTVLYTLAYIAAGVVWSFIKWFSFLMGWRDEYRVIKQAFIDSNSYKGSVDFTNKDTQESFASNLLYHRYRGESLRWKPLASKNKSRIIAWMAFWPASTIGTLLNDPVRRLFNWLFGSFKALYQQLADWVLRNEKEIQ